MFILIVNGKILEEYNGSIKYQPEQGSALLFYQPGNLHEGLPLLSGKKYLMRTDVMFQRSADISDDQKLTSNQQDAIETYRKAQKEELEGNGEASWRLYRKAFHLWPELETLDFDGLQ